MATRKPTPLTLALRVYPEPADSERDPVLPKPWKCPKATLVFDTETRTDATQHLTFGSYRFFVTGRCLEEGLFYADDLPEEDRRVLERYVETHKADIVGGGVRNLKLLTRSQFVDKLFKAVYKGRCLLVGFNLPFDISRIACDFTTARGRFGGGFSLGLWSYDEEAGRERDDHYRPRIGIKHIDSKRALKGFTARKKPDETDLIPEDSVTGEPEKGYIFRGHFLDLRTLAFALTDKGYSLEDACVAFGVKHGKQKFSKHGEVTEEYIDYNRRDVLATSELAVKLLEEYDKHPITLQATKAYSPASIGKAYLRAMGIMPILERQPSYPKEYLGYAQSAFFGGRTSAHIRKLGVPVVYTDFLSMYPTVNILMDLWCFVTAQEISVVKDCKSEIEAFLSRVNADDLFKPATWKYLPAFVRVVPAGDILPTRAKYSTVSNDWQVAVNHVYAHKDSSINQELWFSLPDIVASVILTGRVPKIVDAFRIEPRGTMQGLHPTKLRGSIEIDPTRQDFFKVVIEERKRLASRTDLPENERARLDKALKVLANAASYGIYAEMNPQETDEKTKVTCHGIDCHGIDCEPFTCRVMHPDVPGEYCFPPLASLITGAARLMLALVEHCVSTLGGTYAMEDTDSMAIVATKHGGMVVCPGGSHKTKDEQQAVRTLSRKQVEEISERFTALNLYDREAVPGSVLKIEGDNFDPKTGRQRQLDCFAISAKRYTLFTLDKNGEPVMLRKEANNKTDRWSQHGLGHLLNPTDTSSGDRDWIGQVWLNMVRRSHRLSTQKLSFEGLPAVGRVSVGSPAAMRCFSNFNAGKMYSQQIKPFNFVLTCQIKQLGHPNGVDPARFHLIAPFDGEPRRWIETDWIDLYTGNLYRIATEGHYGTRQTARVKTYGEILREYEFHPEAKCADAEGNTCERQTVGLLQRRHVIIDGIRFIGKESNALEDVEAGLVHSTECVYTEYCDPKRDEWATKILPALKKPVLSFLEKKTPFSRRTLSDWRAGRSRPHRKSWALITDLLAKLTRHP
jgi:hypothetical protein